ncbi:MAG: chemotaxis protein CheD [Bacillota bacterium]
MDKIIGIGEYAVSSDLNGTIKTYALATCVALTAYSPKEKVLGMVHMALPDSNITQNAGILNPAYYVNTAIPLLIQNICLLYGCKKEELVLKLFGGARSIRKDDLFKIGIRNLEMVEAVLKQLNLKISHYDVGGNTSRTVEANIATGETKVAYQALII